MRGVLEEKNAGGKLPLRRSPTLRTQGRFIDFAHAWQIGRFQLCPAISEVP